MDAASLTLRPAAGDLEYVERLLEGNGLPAGDVRSKPDCFYVAADGDRRVGIGGIETHGADGLLRSVVVEEPVRGAGVGTALRAALEEEARAAGVGQLYLLTTTAVEFFEREGYDVVDRSNVPAPIRGTAQFAELCPASATAMVKRL